MDSGTRHEDDILDRATQALRETPVPEEEDAQETDRLLTATLAAVRERTPGEDLATPEDSNQPAVRRDAHVPTELADGVSREIHPIKQPPARRHVPRRFVVMFQRMAVHGRLVKAVAALIALFVGASFLLFHRPASAADALRSVIKANDAYKGWVHVTMKRTGNGQDSTGRSVHFNCADQTMALVDEGDPIRRIQFFSPVTATWSYYDGQQIVLGDLANTRAIDEQTDDHPLTWPEIRERLAHTVEEPTASVRQSRDGLLDRFDVAFDVRSRATGGATRATLSVWTDPGTKLIQRLAFSAAKPDENGAYSATYRYGEPAINDIYAAGAPKDAPVVDKRTTAETAMLVRQVQEATRADAGDYTAILTRSKMKDGGLRTDSGMQLELLVKHGQSCAKHVFWVGRRGPHTAAWMHVLPTPDGWPEPDIETILELLEQYNPNKGQLFDGTTITSYVPDTERGIFSTRSQRETRLDHAWEYVLPTRAYGASLSRYTAGGPGTTFESLPADIGHVGLKGLRVSIMQPARDGPSRLEADIWCDTTRRYVPVEFFVKLVQDGSIPITVERRVFADFVTLGSRRLVPSVWQETSGQSGETYECHLVLLNQVVDERWLSVPEYLPDRPTQH